MKTLYTTLIALGVLAFGSVASAATISALTTPIVTSGPETSTSEIVTLIETTFNVDEVYKQDVGDFDDDNNLIVGTGLESGSFATSYSTTFSNTTTDPSQATITYDGGDSIFCGTCYLLVKDGKQDPAWYLFNLNFWDGEETLELTDFWLGNGAISHVSIYAADGGRGFDCEVSGTCPPAVPIPAAVWLFGSGLLGLVAVGRRKV